VKWVGREGETWRRVQFIEAGLQGKKKRIEMRI
jgi:hypothetical protein